VSPATGRVPSVVLTGHIDVVPVGDRERWTRDPAGELDGDVLYGRGSADMKGGVVAAIEAFTRVANGDRDFAGELRFVAVPGEEDGGTGALAAIRRGWTGDVVIVPEPTSGPDGPQVVVAHGGALTYTIEVDGRSAHAATRLLGESALDHFLTVYKAVERLERELNEAERNPEMVATGLPYPTTVGVVHGGVWASNVMEQITAELRVGVTIDESIPEAEARFERTLRQAIAGDPWLDAHPPRIERTGAAFGSSAIDPDHPLVAALRDAAESETGVAAGHDRGAVRLRHGPVAARGRRRLRGVRPGQHRPRPRRRRTGVDRRGRHRPPGSSKPPSAACCGRRLRADPRDRISPTTRPRTRGWRPWELCDSP
jgi:acetylornithine deacetylase